MVVLEHLVMGNVLFMVSMLLTIFLSMLMTTVQLPNDATKISQIVTHTSTEMETLVSQKNIKNIFQIHHVHMA